MAKGFKKFLVPCFLAVMMGANLVCLPKAEARVLTGGETERKISRKIQGMLKTARKHGDAGRMQPAIDEYWKILELDPAETFAYLELGEIYYRLQIYDRALELLEPGIEAAVKDMDSETVCYYYCIITRVYQALANPGKANQALIKAAQASPQNPMPREVLGDIYLENERYADAMKAYKKALEFDPEYAPAKEKLGDLTAQYGDKLPAKRKDKAAAAKKAVALNPDGQMKPAQQVQSVPAAAESKPVQAAAVTNDAEPEAGQASADNAIPETEVLIAVPGNASSETSANTAPSDAENDPVTEESSSDSADDSAAETSESEPAPEPAVETAAAEPVTEESEAAAAPASEEQKTVHPGEEVEAQLEKLLSGDEEEKAQAADFFVSMKEVGLSEVEELLYDPAPEVRIIAIRTLAKFKDYEKEVAVMFKDALEDTDPMVQEELKKAIGSL